MPCFLLFYFYFPPCRMASWERALRSKAGIRKDFYKSFSYFSSDFRLRTPDFPCGVPGLCILGPVLCDMPIPVSIRLAISLYCRYNRDNAKKEKMVSQKSQESRRLV